MDKKEFPSKKEIMVELIQKEMAEIEKKINSLQKQLSGIDEIDAQYVIDTRVQELKKYFKYETILEIFNQDLNITVLSDRVPDWTSLIKDLVQKDMKNLEDTDNARMNDIYGIDKYDSQEVLDARIDGYARYKKNTRFS